MNTITAMKEALEALEVLWPNARVAINLQAAIFELESVKPVEEQDVVLAKIGEKQ